MMLLLMISVAITTSTKYADLLKMTIPYNYIFFEKWYIITHPDDSETINVVREYDHPNIELVFFDFYKDGALFDKGGAIRTIQQQIPSGTPVLLIDSDIILPENFLQLIPLDMEPDALYSTKFRHEFYSIINLRHKKPNKVYINDFSGFFHLYTQSPTRLYEHSRDASVCDFTFKNTFPFEKRVVLPDLIPKHLGREKINWQGRKGFDFVK